jgi:hypothetical protein
MMSAQPTGPVAGRAIQVVRVEPSQNAGPVQKIVHQRIDRDHAAADLDPEDQLFGSAEQEGGQGHGEDLVRDTVDLPHRLDQGRRHSRQPVRARRTVGGLQLGVDPADQIAVGNVADEQKQGVGGLVEVAIPQVMARHADLSRADLEFASLRNADLTNTSLAGAALGGATLIGVTIVGTDFLGADLASMRLIAPIGLETAKNFDKARNLDRLLRGMNLIGGTSLNRMGP